MQVVLIGSGNVATILANKILAVGHQVVQIISRKKENAQALAKKLHIDNFGDFDAKLAEGDIYILALNDDALADGLAWLKIHKGVVVHTAGAVGKNVLLNVADNFGVLYPLQTLSKQNPKSTEIPFLIDGNSNETKLLIKQFAASISNKVFEVDDLERRKLHLAAVFVNNFANHLFAIAADYCKKENITFEALKPLLSETCTKALEYEPATIQTGPAKRNDGSTIEKHLELLKAYPNYQNLYRLLSKSIQDFYLCNKG